MTEEKQITRNGYTAPQLIRRKLLLDSAEYIEDFDISKESITPSTIDVLWDKYEAYAQDEEYELRCCGHNTDLPTTLHYSWERHYEVDTHALEIDGVWIAYNYVYGGGKHGEPEAYPWIKEAYFVVCEEKEVVTIQRTFTRVDE